MQIKVKLKSVKTSPRKIRQVITITKGLKPMDALAQLSFLNKTCAKPVIEVIKSGLAAAKEKDLALEDIRIKILSCDAGPSQKRRFIGSRGRTSTFMKQTSHINLTLETSEEKPVKTNSKKINTKQKK